MNDHFGYCERCYKKIINIEDIYLRQIDDGEILYCKKKYYTVCNIFVIFLIHTEAEFERLVKVYNIDLAKVTRDTDNECKKKLSEITIISINYFLDFILSFLSGYKFLMCANLFQI